MQRHYFALVGAGTYEFETRGDCFSNIFVYPTGNCEYSLEVTAGDTWVDHPAMLGTNPLTNSATVGTGSVCFDRARVRATSNAGTLHITWESGEFDR